MVAIDLGIISVLKLGSSKATIVGKVAQFRHDQGLIIAYGILHEDQVLMASRTQRLMIWIGVFAFSKLHRGHWVLLVVPAMLNPDLVGLVALIMVLTGPGHKSSKLLGQFHKLRGL